MPTTSKQKDVRKSREHDMLSDIENLKIMLSGNSLDRGESDSSNLRRRPQSPSYENLLYQNGQSHTHAREAEIMSYAQNGHSATEVDSSSECIRLSGELKQRFSQEMGDFMRSVSS